MIKMATGEGSPLRQGAGTGSRLFLVAIEACGGGTPDLLLSSMLLGYMQIYRRKKSVEGASRGPREGRVRPVGWACPLSCGFLDDPPACTPSLLDHVRSKNHASEGFIPFGLRLISLFFEILK